jgi:type 1 glutamine amidotransferase
MNTQGSPVGGGLLAPALVAGLVTISGPVAWVAAQAVAADSPVHSPTPVLGEVRHPTNQAPVIVFLIGEDEYRTAETLPEFARRELEPRGCKTIVLQENSKDRGNYPALVEALPSADLLCISLRRRALPQAQMRAVRAHLDAGKPVAGIRTACHAFAPRDQDRDKLVLEDGRAEWPQFDPEVLGGNYVGHHSVGPTTTIRPAPAAANLSLLAGVGATPFSSPGSLYRVSPLAASTTTLLIGSIPDQPPEPVAWINTYGPKHARVFYTSLGHPDDFGQPMFRRLLLNGILWALDRPVELRPGHHAP